jgi:hypothetical protein
MARHTIHIAVTAVLVVLLAGEGVAGGHDARGVTVSAAEFDRITADIRAAGARHDARAYHAFHAQLVELIRAATSG